VPPLPLRRRLALWLAAVLGLWTAAVVASGGVSFVLGGLRVSSRSAERPAALALVMLVLALWRLPAEARRRWLRAVADGADRQAPWLAAVLALAVTLLSVQYGSHVAGGSDSSGYLSQSLLWGAGRLTADAPVISDAPWPARGQLVAPLGYRPTPAPDQLGPTYAPGLPLLMALGAGVAGDAGRYVWTPLAAGLLVWATFRLAAFTAPPAAALAAAALVATSPPMLFQATETMSDLPVAALWAWALVWLRRPGAGARAAAGVFSGVALLVRPNMAPAAAAVWTAVLAQEPGSLRQRLMPVAMGAAPVALAALAVALVNALIWGSPFISGYGPPESLYSRSAILPNLQALWTWTAETRGYWTAAGLAALVALAAQRGGGRAWWPGLALVAGALASYLTYATFIEWWYLRFYLPAWPVLAAAIVAAVWQLLAAWSRDAARLTLAAAAVAVTALMTADVRDRQLFELWRGNQRYAAVGRYVDGHAGRDAVILALQHSGAVSYYSGRAIARFDEVPSDMLDAFCTALAAAGREVWLVVDQWEEPEIRARFPTQRRGRLDWAPIAQARVGPARVHVYDMATPTRATAPTLIPVAAGGPWPWARQRDGPAK
jgi:hypothetical protein